MQGYRGAFPWPVLLLLPSAWAVLRVSVPSSPIRSPPLADVRLPCNFSGPSRPISLRSLAVMWKKDSQTVAEYVGGFKPTRKGAEMSEERLRVGDASLLLPRLQDSDSGVYTCVVTFTPEREEGSFQLKLEAEPHIVLGSTKMQLAQWGTLTCTAAGFYPRDISVEWLKDDVVMKDSQTSVHQDSQNGLYTAINTLELLPSVADADARLSCQVRHQSLESSLKEDFQLHLQALPILQVSTLVSRNTLEMLVCLVSGFYPQDIQVHWLRNGVPQSPIESQPQMLPNGTFSMKSLNQPQETDPDVSYVCQVRHNEWDDPVNLSAHWQPKEEGTVVIWSWLVLGLGLVLCLAGGIMTSWMAFEKGKNMSYPSTRSKGHLNPESAERMWKPENDYATGSSTTPM